MTSQIKVDRIQGAAGTTVTIPAGTTIANLGTATGFGGGGGVLQVKYAEKLDTQDTSANGADVDVTGLSLDITPAATGNKILVGFDMCYWGNDSIFHIARDGTKIAVPTTASGSRTLGHSGGCSREVHDVNSCSIQILDAPATTSAVTYKVQWSNTGSSTANRINRSDYDQEGTPSNGERCISTIWAMEVASGAL